MKLNEDDLKYHLNDKVEHYWEEERMFLEQQFQ